MAVDLTPDSFKITPLKKKILPDEGSDALGATIGGLGQTKTSYVDTVIDKSRLTLKMSTIFEHEGRFTDATGGISGFIAVGAGNTALQMDAGIASNSYAQIDMPVAGSALTDIAVFNGTSFTSIIRLLTAGAGNGNFFIGVKDVNGTFDGTTMAITGIDQYGFKVLKSGGTATLYATSANKDGTETTTSLGTMPEDESMYITAVITADSQVQFTVQSANVDKTATHKTNIPDSTTKSDAAMFIFVNNANTGNKFEWLIASYSFEKFSGGLY